MDVEEAQGILRLLLKGSDSIELEQSEDLYGHLLMDEATRREKLFYYLPEVETGTAEREREKSMSRDPVSNSTLCLQTITFSYLVETILGVSVRRS